MGYCTHESRLVLRSAEIQPFIPRFVRFSCAIDLCRLIVQICTPTNTYTHTHHRLYTHRLDTHTHTHTHLPCCATPPSGGALALHTPTTPRRRIPRNSACTYTRMRVSVRAHACCTGKRRPGLFSLRFSSRVTGCSTHPVSHTTCALRLPCREFIFRPHSRTGCLTHFHTHTIMSRRCQMCLPLSALHLLACRFVVPHPRDRHRGGR